ncbi:MAG: hypothetical protein IPM54_03155 [Polyangiaceae bacterium]|nr:hypothetical protein [Polyangiaceae bacterium]
MTPVADVFTVGALALAAEGANAVGAVRITLFERDMEIELVRAARFERGFVMASVVEAAPMRVPYAAVRGLVRRGRALCLALDPQLATPHTRFTLAHFTLDPRDALARAYVARQRAALFVAAMPLLLGSLVAVAAPPSLVSGAVGRLSAAAVVAIVSWFVMRELFQAATWGGAASDRLSDAFERALCLRLGLEPTAPAPAANLPLLAEDPDPASPSRHTPPWMRPVFAVLAVAAFVVASVAFFRKYSAPPDPSERITIKEPAARISSVWSAAPVEAIVPPKPRLPRCVCPRPSSPLWNDGILALEVLFAARPDDGSGVVVPMPDKRNRPRYDFDVSVVNNASTPLPEVTVLLTFARRDEAGTRVGATDRGLYFAGPLLPGRAVKWHVVAPGTEMRVEPSVVGMLDADRAPASADAFFELSRARLRTVRMHAAKMLAYHRDKRVHDVLAALGPPKPGEERLLARIARVSRDVFACDIKSVEASFEVCLVNTTLKPARVAAVSPLGADDAVAGRHALDVEVPVHDGVRVRLSATMQPLPQEMDLELVK